MTVFFKNLFKKNIIWYISGGVLSVIPMILLFVFSRGEVFATKHLILGGALCVGTFLVFVTRKLSLRESLVFLLLYLIWVPGKIFDRMELPIHNMVNMLPQAKLVTIGMIIVFWALLFVICQRIRISIAVGNILLFLIACIEFYVNKFRGSVVGPTDFLAADTAISVMGNYDYTPDHELIYSLVWFVFFVAAAFKINITPATVKERFAGYRTVLVHALASAFSLILTVVCLLVLFKTDFLTNHGINSDNRLYVKVNENVGSILYPLCEWHKNNMREPKGYSAERLKEIGAAASESFVPLHEKETEVKPNIIYIMNEALSDLRVLGDIETNEPVTPFMDSLAYSDRAIKGKLYMPVLGGLTVNSEFEALTGNSMYYLAGSAIPYENMINSDMPSMATELKALGYSTTALHPNTKVAYGRDDVYDHFGFDEFVDAYSFDDPEFIGNFISDDADYDKLIELYENRDKEKPFFCFNVTIQNHGGYSGELRDIYVTSINGTELANDEVYVSADHYLTLINKSDKAFERLLSYFETVDEPVIVCMFGDHQPILQDSFYNRIFKDSELSDTQKEQNKYITNYIIWANYDADFTDIGDFSANYLSSVLLDEAGLPMSQFRKFQRNLMNDVPILSAHETADYAGRLLSSEDLAARETINEYRMFQYCKLFDYNEKAASVFEPETYNAFSKSRDDADADKPWYEKYSIVTHALGVTGDGKLHTNSLEAFICSYKKGQRIFEADVVTASDDVMVLRHDWVLDLGQSSAFGWEEGKDHRQPSSEEYLNTPIYGEFTPLSLEQWFKIMNDHPDIWFVTDIKADNDIPAQYKLFVKTAVDNGYASVLDRVIVQIYSTEMLDIVDAVYPFENYILTTYWMGPIDPDEAESLYENPRMHVLTMPEYVWSERGDTYADRQNYRVFVHTVDDPEKATELLSSLEGLYSDTLTERQADYILRSLP